MVVMVLYIVAQMVYCCMHSQCMKLGQKSVSEDKMCCGRTVIMLYTSNIHYMYTVILRLLFQTPKKKREKGKGKRGKERNKYIPNQKQTHTK